MRNRLTYKFTWLFILWSITCSAQNESKKWYFGTQAGLDFMTTPPTIITNAAMSAWEGCASIADAAGNLLFYTDGITVYNVNNVAMANGTGLLGNSSSTQSGVIIKRPGSNSIYYVFTLGAMNGPLNYSTIDMTLAAGLGSVTVLNTPLYPSSSEKLTAVRHCNGTDVWAISHDMNNNNFRTFLITAAGVNPVPVISSLGTTYIDARGYLKASPNGKKIGLGDYSVNNFEIYDFDNSTGVVSNQLILANHNSPYGCEFSPDGTKFYGACEGGPNIIYQWDLCAGSNQAIVASQYSIQSVGGGLFALQAAANGKIYAVHISQQYLGIINSPNVYGAGCNYVDNGQSIAPRSNALGLPNFITSIFSTPPNFTYTVSALYGCNTASFNASALQLYQQNICGASAYTGLSWDFGDPLSGAANTSTLSSPSHSYTSIGTYTARLVMYNSNPCGAVNDTVQQVINVNLLCISVVTQSISCASLGSATAQVMNGFGPFSYTWMPGGQIGPVATGLNPGTYTVFAFDAGSGITHSLVTTLAPSVGFSGTLSAPPYQPCANANTGTASIALAGGSGNQSYLWTGPNGTQTTAIATGLGAGNYTVAVVDALTACSVTQTFTLGPPPPPLGVIASVNVVSVCAGAPVSFNATGYGGTPLPPANFNYSWSPGGATTNPYTTLLFTPGVNIYTITVIDANNCTAANTVSVNVIPNPLLVFPSVPVCGQQTATLSVSGASSYTWNSGSNATSLTASPPVTTGYTVTGSALGCTSVATASIIVKSVPVVTVSSNSPICANTALQLLASSGSIYIWTGPSGFNSALQNPLISLATVNNSGIYNFTLTAANGCTASAAVNATVNALPSISVSDATICTTQTVNFNITAPAAVSYSWTGPNGFTSSVQNPVINNPPLSASGIYMVSVSSANGCINAASVNITISDLPFPMFTTDSPKCQGSTLNFNSSGSTGGIVYNWSGPNGFSSLALNPVISPVSPAANGIYTLQLTTGACIASITQAVTIYPNPIPIILNNSPVCETKTASLSVTAVYPSYAWAGPMGYTNTTQGVILPDAIIQQSGTYSVVVTDTNTCQGTATTVVTVMPNPTLSVLGADVCYGSQAILTASGAVTYVWSGPDGFSAFTAQATIPSAANTNALTYNVMGTALNTCTAVASVQLTTRPVPIAEATLTARACVNDPVYFTGKGGVSSVWTGPLNFYSPLQNFSITVQNTGMSGIYTLTVADETGCKGMKMVSLVVDPKPQGSLWSNNTDRCVPFCSDFKLSSSSGAAIVTTSWQIDNHVFSTDTFKYCFTKVGDYVVHGNFSDANDCKAEISFVVNAYPLPKADFSYSPLEPIENDAIDFVSTSTGEGLNNWSWYFASNAETSVGYSSATHVFENAGVYPVAMVLTNKWGCEDTIVKTVKVEEDFYLFVPNAFTPNEDALNETFHAVGRGIKTFSMLIFDRWGEKVFESSSINTGWDGTYKGKPCKDDEYAWKLTATNAKGKEKKMTGSVLLYR